MLITTFFLPFQHFYSQKQGGNVDFLLTLGHQTNMNGGGSIKCFVCNGYQITITLQKIELVRDINCGFRLT